MNFEADFRAIKTSQFWQFFDFCHFQSGFQSELERAPLVAVMQDTAIS